MSWNVILFDLDGTISDSGPGITRCAHYALKTLGYDAPEPEALGFFVGPPLEESFREGFGMGEELIPQGVRLFRERYAEKGILEHAPYPGMPALLRSLHGAGKRLGLASSKPRIYGERILADYGVLDCFAQVMGSELDGRFGTKTLVMEELLRRMDIREGERASVIMVGDRSYDIQGAHNHGLPCAAVSYGYAAPGELTAAEYIVPTVEALRALLLRD